ncbi:MAG: UDP-N-acetylenolpyruvoylglucosamine reductase [Pelagibacteraceae bacterium]|nr:UDP-N-acetylenolpyruvoylglucosamine reductase [Pelagibacteraceae bacterium]|tara:strand:+ start:3726 stop:4652 length:927 start_codon:yes stop_codon:yes gene_type:complete
MIISEIKKNLRGILLENESMAKHTSYGIGGEVKAYITPYDVKDLIKIIRIINKNNLKFYFVGSGSNLLVNDKKINGIIITPAKALKSLTIKKSTVNAESGVMLGRLVKESIKHNLTGLESLVGVPGTLGGALMMNAGAWGSEISNFLVSVNVINTDGKIKTLYPEDLEFKYRYSSFNSNEFILSAKFELSKATKAEIKKKKVIASKGRISSQPLKFRSAGSVFKNPHDKLAAGFLIDEVGLKGTRIGGAEISTHHANFFINHGNAKAIDITGLIRLSRKKIYEKFGIMLELEIKTIGFESSDLYPYES